MKEFIFLLLPAFVSAIDYVEAQSPYGFINFTHPVTTSINASEIVWPQKSAIKLKGDVTLGGLFIVHQRDDQHTCGQVSQNGIQDVELMLYALDYVNNQTDLLPGFTIGAYILDSCDGDAKALDETINFIRGSATITEGQCSCTDGSDPIISDAVSMVDGVVGPSSSVVSVQVANLLRVFKIPQISYWSTSPDLSNKERFEYFSRTVPSDKFQAKAIVEFLYQFKWTYFSVVYEDSNYGSNGYDAIEEEARARNMCIAIHQKIPRDKQAATDSDFDEIIKSIIAGNAKAVVVFALEQEAERLMDAANRANTSNHEIAWIATDGWSRSQKVIKGREHVVEGAIGFGPLFADSIIAGYNDYFRRLTPNNNMRNPWFVEYWEHRFNCRYPNGPKTPFNEDLTRECNESDTLTDELSSSPKLKYIGDAVFAFVNGLIAMHAELCGSQYGLCEKMKNIDGELFLNFVRTVNFTDLNGNGIYFLENGDAPARYQITNFQANKEGDTSYSWKEVGTYKGGLLHLNMSAMQYTKKQSYFPTSVCSEPCQEGYAKRVQEDKSCCWVCDECDKYQYLKDEGHCEECKFGSFPDEFKTTCIETLEQYVRFDSGWGISCIFFASLGIVLVFFAVGIFIYYNDTPLVKASGRELSLLLLLGLLLCYLTTFVIVAKPTVPICGIARFMGLPSTLCYAAMLTKTNRISRIFNRNPKRPTNTQRVKFTSSLSQIVISFGITFVEVLIVVIWLVMDPPKTKYYHPLREQNQLICEGTTDARYMVGLGYPMLLGALCTIYAFMTRKCPDGFNEAKYIGFTMYSTCVIWVSFVAIYFTSSHFVELRVTTLCISISLCAYVIFGCLFVPKIYIILLRPEKNTRSAVMSVATTNGNRSRPVLNSNTDYKNKERSVLSAEHDNLMSKPVATSRIHLNFDLSSVTMSTSL